MPAQLGGSIVLSYGPQGDQQAGGAILLSYQQPETTRRVSASSRAPWGQSEGLGRDTKAPSAAISVVDQGRLARWLRSAKLQDSGDLIPWRKPAERDDERRGTWGKFNAKAQPEPRAPWVVGIKRDHERRNPWGRFERVLQPQTWHPWAIAIKRDHERFMPWGGPMIPIALGQTAVYAQARPADQTELIPWAFYSRQLDPGWGIPTPPNPQPEPGETVVIPVQRFYIVQNEAILIRASDLATIPALRMSLRLDVDSWAWGFSATIPQSALGLVEPTGGQPRELEAVINGVQFRVLAESLTRDRIFGSGYVTISGRGKAATLAAPYAPILSFSNDEERTANQLAEDVLTLNGVALPWAVNWGLTDWNVPAGAFNTQGSYMDGLLRIAQAAGGYIRPDPYLQELNFLHRYPSLPDTWASITTPDFELPSAITTREGIEWRQRPNYEGVYVSGTGQGVIALVKRAETATPEIYAPMIADELITASNAARQRGRAILGETGRAAFVTLRVPMLETLGLVEPGKFVEYVDGGTTRIGLVRSTNIDVERPTIWQTLTVETHDP